MIHDGLRQLPNYSEYAGDQGHTDEHRQQIRDQLRQIIWRDHIYPNNGKELGNYLSHENPSFSILAQAATKAPSSNKSSKPSVTV